MSKQADSTPSAKSENKPVGSANAVAKHDFEGDGFWMAMEDVVPLVLTIGVDLDPCLGDLDDLENDTPSGLVFNLDSPNDYSIRRTFPTSL